MLRSTVLGFASAPSAPAPDAFRPRIERELDTSSLLAAFICSAVLPVDAASSVAIIIANAFASIRCASHRSAKLFVSSISGIEIRRHSLRTSYSCAFTNDPAAFFKQSTILSSFITPIPTIGAVLLLPLLLLLPPLVLFRRPLAPRTSASCENAPIASWAFFPSLSTFGAKATKSLCESAVAWVFSTLQRTG